MTRTGFMVHYSSANPYQTVREIQRFHQQTRGWADIGYNLLVDVRGTAFEGRQHVWRAIGAHAEGHNTANIGVCAIGGDGDITDAQRRTIRALYDEACHLAGRRLAIRWHGLVNPTACPGPKLTAWARGGLALPTSSPPPAPPASTWTERLIMENLPTLRQGAEGRAVRKVQGLCNVWLPGRELDIDGDFGPNTLAGVQHVQRTTGIAVDGVVGPDTWTALLTR